MKEFYQENLYISKIYTCVLVPKGTGRPIHQNRSSHGLVINLSGDTYYVFDGKHEYHVLAEELFYLPKYSNYHIINNSTHSTCIAVNFDLMDPFVTYPFFSLPADFGHKYVLEFQQLLDEWNIQRNGYMNRCISHLYHIICMCQQDKAKQQLPAHTRKLINTGASYIAQHLAESKLSISAIADQLGVTPEYFRKLFHEAYGVSPKQYILNLRMERAKELIVSGELRINAIAQMCGYEDGNYFSREFKRMNGCPPTHYAKKQME